ncbi:MAG: RNA polymerase B [Alectoria sarmentosa]|nr:MAG: RNA polymerase B [Alectoria sarmentosa]
MAETNATAPTSRAREQVGGDEEATSDLKLGEFQNVHSMSLSEARALIIAILAHRATTKKVEETETLIKTQDYLDVFARFKNTENITAVERVLGAHPQLEPFEKSQLGAYDCWGAASLCCESAEEAKTLIPSLTNKITDVDLQEILDDITKLRTFVD